MTVDTSKGKEKYIALVKSYHIDQCVNVYYSYSRQHPGWKPGVRSS